MEKSFKDNVQNFTPLVETATKLGVRVGIENIPVFPDLDKTFFSCYTKDQIRLIDYFNRPETVCAVWDTGHSNLMNHDQPTAIKEVGSRIKATHVHNNFKKYDEHFSPSMGTVNWREVTGALRDIGYDGYLTLESNYYENELMEEYVKHLYDSIVKVEKLFLNEE